MLLSNFTTTTHGKWILAGEHAVIRGYPALVFPIPTKKLTLSYQRHTEPLILVVEGTDDTFMRKMLDSVLVHAVTLLQNDLPRNGHLHLINHIKVGAGMGASAALCVAVTRLCIALKLLSSNDAFHFAKHLESVFHGKSSGVDIAGTGAESDGVYFYQGTTTSLELAWQPNWALSYCGEKGETAQCVQQVNKLRVVSKAQAAAIDKSMAEAVSEAHTALQTPHGLDKLVNAINIACQCFADWGLITPAVQTHMHLLKSHGALAVKPTGSGGGGYVLSLWDKDPADIPQLESAALLMV